MSTIRLPRFERSVGAPLAGRGENATRLFGLSILLSACSMQVFRQPLWVKSTAIDTGTAHVRHAP